MDLDLYVFGVVGSGLVLLALAWRLVAAQLAPRQGKVRSHYEYDVIVVGCSIAGPAVAKALSDQQRKVLVIERDLFEKPDRIVGELMQPGGMLALDRLGMKECAESIGSLCTGYCVVDEADAAVSLPYKEGFTGVSFHFGDFVQNLRAFVWKNCSQNVTMTEGIVTDVLTDGPGRVYGVEYLRDEAYAVPANAFTSSYKKVSADGQPPRKKVKLTATAPLVIMCDGGSSKYKTRLAHYTPSKSYHSHFVGVILQGIQLPMESRGHVFFGKTGPILSYRLDGNEVRLLVDYDKSDLPDINEQARWLREDVACRLPCAMGAELRRVASDVRNVRSMPISQYPPTTPATLGYVGIGDHNNQRHPLTGGGMTCAIRDAVLIADLLSPIPRLRDPNNQDEIDKRLQAAVVTYARRRWQHSACINILSWALYAVFNDVGLRNACFDYFLLGGDAVGGPMQLLAGLDPRALTLLRHYVKVMVLGACNVVTLTGKYSSNGSKDPTRAEIVWNIISFFFSPRRLFGSIFLLLRAAVIFTPLVYFELISLWSYLNPLGTLATSVRAVRMQLHIALFRGKQGKPVGL